MTKIKTMSAANTNDPVVLEARLTRVEGAVDNIAITLETVSKQLSSLSTDVNAQRKPNWTALGIVLAVVTGLWALGTQPISQRVSMTEQALVQVNQNISDIAAKVAVSAVNDAQSMTDRQKLNSMVEKISATQSDNKAEIAHLNVAIGEIETQLHDHENTFGLVRVSLEREISRLYEKVFQQRYPSDIHFDPSIAKQRDMGLK